MNDKALKIAREELGSDFPDTWLNGANIMLPDHYLWMCVLFGTIREAVRGDGRTRRQAHLWLFNEDAIAVGSVSWVCDHLRLEKLAEIRMWVRAGGSGRLGTVSA